MQRLLTFGLLLGLSAPAVAQSGAQPAAPTIDAIRSAGHLTCGTVASEDDWNDRDQHGDLSGLGGEVCRAVALALLGERAQIDLVTFPAEPEALNALKSGQIQLAVGVSPGAETAVQYGVGFGPVVFYDTQRFLVLKDSSIHSAADLGGKVVCVMEGSPALRTLQDTMTARGIRSGIQAHSEQGEMDASVAVAHCAAGAALESRLADSRADFPANAPEFSFLPDRLGLSPVVPAFRYGDQKFGLIVDAAVNALIEAEALGITKANVVEAKKRTDLRAERLLGGDRTVAQALGLALDWSVQMISVTGNYGEIFDRTVGKTYRLERGINALWTEGGLIHPMPLQ